MIFRLLIILFFLSLEVACTAQVHGIAGYNMCYFYQGNSFLDIHEYKMDTQYPEAEFDISDMGRGPVFGCRFTGNNFFGETLFAYRSIKSNTTEPVLVGGDPYLYRVKFSVNTFNLGFGYGSNNVKIGASVDFGRLKLLKKYDTQEAFDQAAWESLFDGEHTTHMGYSLFACFILHPVEIRPFFHGNFFQDKLGSVVHHTMSGVNTGVAVNLLIGRRSY